MARDGRGGVVCIVGPDGAGKSTLADALVARLQGAEVLRVHQRPSLLPRRTRSTGPVTDPHGRSPDSWPLSLLKLGYLYLDTTLGWAFVLRPFTRRGGWVVLERGWWDLAIDPRRYLLRVPRPIVRLLARSLPSVDLLLVLDGPAHVLWLRSRELPESEVERQLQDWRELRHGYRRRAVLDAAATPTKVAAAAGRELDALRSRHAADRP